METPGPVGHHGREHRSLRADRGTGRALRLLCEPPVTRARVGVVAFAQSPCERQGSGTTGGVEMLVPLFAEVYRQTGLSKGDIGFWCSGSSDYLAGRAFSFVQAIDAIGAVPPVMESHVEMDGAWALYEAWVKVLTGDAEIALAYGFGKSSGAELRRVLALQLDPYLVAPLWPDSVSLAALQARLGIERGLWTEQDMAQVAAGSRAAATANPFAQLSGEVSTEELLKNPYIAEPLRAHDCAPVGDGAAVVVIASEDRARELCEQPAWITGFEHRIDSAAFGSRDLLTLPSATAAAQAAGLAGVGRGGPGGRVPPGGRRGSGGTVPSGGSRRAARAVYPPGDPAAPGPAPRRRRKRESVRRGAGRESDVRGWTGKGGLGCAGDHVRPRGKRRRPLSKWNSPAAESHLRYEEIDEKSCRGDRCRADPPPVTTDRCVDRGAVPGGGGPCAG